MFFINFNQKNKEKKIWFLSVSTFFVFSSFLYTFYFNLIFPFSFICFLFTRSEKKELKENFIKHFFCSSTSVGIKENDMYHCRIKIYFAIAEMFFPSIL